MDAQTWDVRRREIYVPFPGIVFFYRGCEEFPSVLEAKDRVFDPFRGAESSAWVGNHCIPWEW